MKRRSFLTLLGLSPVVAKAAPSGERFNTLSDWRTMNSGAEACVESAEFDRLWHMPAIQRIFANDFGNLAVDTPPRTREGNGG